MQLSLQLHQQLRGLLGQAICYRGKKGRIIEFLEREQALVVELEDTLYRLQESQYGEPGRQVSPTHLLPIFDPQQPGQLNQELASFDITL